MFTGIIEQLGEVVSLEQEAENLHIEVKAAMAPELKIDQSVAHNGVCLTVVELSPDSYTVTAILETLRKSNLGKLEVGSVLNLERCMQMGGRLDGHIVQGHVDTTATLKAFSDEDGSWIYTFSFDPKHAGMVVEKGSITINGVSLTLVNVKNDEFSVAIIPYTHEHTNFHTFRVGDEVNIEFDVIGKYVARMMETRLESMGQSS